MLPKLKPPFKWQRVFLAAERESMLQGVTAYLFLPGMHAKASSSSACRTSQLERTLISSL